MSVLLLAVLLATGSWPAFSQPSPIYAWTNFVGQPGGTGNADGTGSAARFYLPNGVAVDSAGNVYVADSHNYTIRRVTSGGVVTTLAGSVGNQGSVDGTGSAARFNYPAGVAADSAGNVYVADSSNHTIRKITSGGVVTTLAGSAGASGTNDGTGNAAQFNQPGGVAVDSAGNVYVADSRNHTIRKITDGGAVTTLAGSAGSQGTNDGTGSTAQFYYPRSVAVDSAGDVYVADSLNHTIRKITSDGVVTTLAGFAGASGSADGTGTAARFNQPTGMTVDSGGNVYVADYSNDTIRKVTSGGVVTTLAGSAGNQGSADGTGSTARFYWPCSVAVDSTGNVYITDWGNNTLRKATSGGTVTTMAGSAGQDGTNNGTGSAARFHGPSGVAVDGARNLYVGDCFNYTIRKVTSGGVVTTLAGSAGQYGTNDGTGSAARFTMLYGVAVDSAGNVYVTDAGNRTIRKVTSAGVVTTLAGSAGQSGTNDGTGSAARFNSPNGVAVDSAGNVYVADSGNRTIRKVTSGGVVTTLAGSPQRSGTNDGTGSAARFNNPAGVAVDKEGNVYVAEYDNCTIRKITSASVVTTIGGIPGVIGCADGLGSSANFAHPIHIAVDSAGNLYVADFGNNRISKGTPLYPWITAGFDGTHVQLSWPANCLGWELQAQTNLPGAGLGANWSPVAGSTTSTQMSIPIDPASPSVFYRLHHL